MFGFAGFDVFINVLLVIFGCIGVSPYMLIFVLEQEIFLFSSKSVSLFIAVVTISFFNKTIFYCNVLVF